MRLFGIALLETAVLLAVTPVVVESRVNATGAYNVFMISDCASCTADKDSIFCTAAASPSNGIIDYLGNGSITIAQKISQTNALDGNKFCWQGTFGKLLSNQGNYTWVLGSQFVYASLGCDQTNLYYRQCVLPAQLSIILISVAAVALVLTCTCCCFYCGLCTCLNNAKDESKWGLCNRFCPWMPCSDPPEPESTQPEWMQNPSSEQENMSSLFGRNPMLNAVSTRSLDTDSPVAGSSSNRSSAALTGAAAGAPKPSPASDSARPTSSPLASTSAADRDSSGSSGATGSRAAATASGSGASLSGLKKPGQGGGAAATGASARNATKSSLVAPAAPPPPPPEAPVFETKRLRSGSNDSV